MITSTCCIELLGGLVVRQEQRVLSRFPTRKSASLLAYLACFKAKAHGREQLADRFWPGLEPEAARHNLRQTLFSLRRLLEPPGVPAGSILIADKAQIRLNAKAVRTDVAEFEHLLHVAARAVPLTERLLALEQAAALYKGEFLPDVYDEWALLEQGRLSAAWQQMLDELAALYVERGHTAKALDCLRQLVSANPFNTAAQESLIRLHAACNQPKRAHQQFQRLADIMAAEWSETPPNDLRAFVETLPLAPPSRSLTMLTALRSPLSVSPLPATPAPLHTPSPRLPVPLTRFFGREEELRQTLTLLTTPQHCLLTLLGPGGSGKTRLAVELGHRLAPAFHNSVYFVPLAGLSSAQAIPGAIAHALEWTLSPSFDPVEQLATALERMPSLLILDNLEHLLPASADTVTQLIGGLMQRVSTLRCLVTSRQRLNIEGEREYQVRPLPVPASTYAVEDLVAFPSMAIFLDRAQAIRPDFGLTDGNASTLVALCQRLEGVPLALELAAAQIGVFSPAQMMTQLENRFAFLVHRTRGIAPRHRSLHAALQWSFNLLPPDLQTVLLRLSVFRGGWTLQAAQAICDDENIVDSLHSLREASLIVAEEQGDGIRFRMLEMVREFAAGLLGSEQEALGYCHANYFQGYLEDTKPQLSGPLMTVWLDRLEREYDNLVAALVWQRDHNSSDLYFTSLMWPLWYMRGYYWEAREWITASLQHDTNKTFALRAQMLNAAGTLAWYQSEYDRAQVYFDEALGIHHHNADQNGVGITLSNLSLLKRDQGDYLSARTLAEQSLETARRFQYTRCMAFALYNIGCAALLQGDYHAAEDALTECILLREEGDFWGLGFTLTAQGELACAQGLYAQAQALFQESLGMFRDIREQQGIAGALHGMGKVAFAAGDYDSARDYLLESLRLHYVAGRKTGIFQLFCTLSLLAAAENQWTRAARLLGFVHAGKHIPLTPSERAQVEAACAVAGTVLGEAVLVEIWAQTDSLLLEQVVMSLLPLKDREPGKFA